MIFKRTVYLDNAASSFPKPSEVTRKVSEMLKNNTANPGRSGHSLSEKAAEIIFNTRSEAADFFGIKGHEENVIFTFNATHAINTALRGLLSSGDRVIISDVEHNSVLRPLIDLKKSGVFTDIATVHHDDKETLRSFEKLIRPETRMIFVTHASNVSGQKLPISALGDLCERHGLLFGVDASQTAGHTSINITGDKISVLCAPGHKGLLSPQGTGLLVLSPIARLTVKPLLFGGTGSDSLSEYQPSLSPEALESGTLNTAGIAGLCEGIRYCKTHKYEIMRNINDIFTYVYDELSRLPYITLYSPKTDNAGLIAFSVGNLHSDDVTARLDADKICVRGGFHCSSLFHKKAGTTEKGLVRVSPGAFNNEKNAIDLLISIKRLKI